MVKAHLSIISTVESLHALDIWQHHNPLEGVSLAKLLLQQCKVISQPCKSGRYLAYLRCGAEQEAKSQKVDRLVLLTTRTADWFEQRGFQHAGPAHASPFLPETRRQQVPSIITTLG